jgi:hypothetical protein
MSFGNPTWKPSRVITLAMAEKGERVERRRHVRVQVELPARYLAPDGGEFDAVTVNVSAVAVRFRASHRPRPGDEIVAYVQDLGRMAGSVLRVTEDGFVLLIKGTALKAERLQQKIDWLKPSGAPDRRLFPRVTVEGAMIGLRCADGREDTARIVDVSTSGIAVRTELVLHVGETLDIGEQKGVIVRLFEGGAAARFV